MNIVDNCDYEDEDNLSNNFRIIQILEIPLNLSYPQTDVMDKINLLSQNS